VLVLRGIPAWLAARARWVPPQHVLAGPVSSGMGARLPTGAERDLVEVLLSMALRGRKGADR
jgi:hypothetical protein